MRMTGLYWGARLLEYVDFPTPEILGPEAQADEIQQLIDRCGEVMGLAPFGRLDLPPMAELNGDELTIHDWPDAYC